MQNSRNTLIALVLGSAIGLSNALGSALGGMRSLIAAPQVQTAACTYRALVNNPTLNAAACSRYYA